MRPFCRCGGFASSRASCVRLLALSLVFLGFVPASICVYHQLCLLRRCVVFHCGTVVGFAYPSSEAGRRARKFQTIPAPSAVSSSEVRKCRRHSLAVRDGDLLSYPAAHGPVGVRVRAHGSQSGACIASFRQRSPQCWTAGTRRGHSGVTAGSLACSSSAERGAADGQCQRLATTQRQRGLGGNQTFSRGVASRNDRARPRSSGRRNRSVPASPSSSEVPFLPRLPPREIPELCSVRLKTRFKQNAL